MSPRLNLIERAHGARTARPARGALTLAPRQAAVRVAPVEAVSGAPGAPGVSPGPGGTPDLQAQRVREAGGPVDSAFYGCACGYHFRAAVSTSVACPHCGAPQDW